MPRLVQIPSVRRMDSYGVLYNRDQELCPTGEGIYRRLRSFLVGAGRFFSLFGLCTGKASTPPLKQRITTWQMSKEEAADLKSLRQQLQEIDDQINRLLGEDLDSDTSDSLDSLDSLEREKRIEELRTKRETCKSEIAAITIKAEINEQDIYILQEEKKVR